MVRECLCFFMAVQGEIKSRKRVITDLKHWSKVENMDSSCKVFDCKVWELLCRFKPKMLLFGVLIDFKASNLIKVISVSAWLCGKQWSLAIILWAGVWENMEESRQWPRRLSLVPLPGQTLQLSSLQTLRTAKSPACFLIHPTLSY